MEPRVLWLALPCQLHAAPLWPQCQLQCQHLGSLRVNEGGREPPLTAHLISSAPHSVSLDLCRRRQSQKGKWPGQGSGLFSGLPASVLAWEPQHLVLTLWLIAGGDPRSGGRGRERTRNPQSATSECAGSPGMARRLGPRGALPRGQWFGRGRGEV